MFNSELLITMRVVDIITFETVFLVQGGLTNKLVTFVRVTTYQIPVSETVRGLSSSILTHSARVCRCMALSQSSSQL